MSSRYGLSIHLVEPLDDLVLGHAADVVFLKQPALLIGDGGGQYEVLVAAALGDIGRKLCIRDRYYGKVVRIIPIGAFVELAPGKDGMIHIKDLEFKRTEKVEDVLNIGDMTWVKVTEIDDRGRVNLSRKDAIKEREAMGLKDCLLYTSRCV